MLAVDKRAFPATANVKDHLDRVRTKELRPSLQKYYFPMSVKEVLQGAWLPMISRRSDSSQLVKSLNLILPVLEGKGLVRRETRINAGNGNKNSCILNLPKRATALVEEKTALLDNETSMDDSSSSMQGWDQVWNPKQQNPSFESAAAVAEKRRVKMHTAMLNNPALEKHIQRRHKEKQRKSKSVILF